MRAWFVDANIDYLSPQLYTTGNEGANDWATSGGVQWSEYANCRAKIIPSIVSSSMYQDTQSYFAARGVTTAGYIQWQQGPPVKVALRCGISWDDASSRCGTSCPTGQDTSCPSGQKCFNNVDPSVCGANANEATVVEEQQQIPTTTPSNNVGEEVPAWAIALLALGSILVVGVFAALVVLIKPIQHSERF